MHSFRRLLPVAASTVGALLAGAWLGALLVLGAVVAPTVFHTVPDGRVAADAMTRVFRGYDRVAMACAAALVLVEGIRSAGALRARPSRLSLVRVGATLVASGLAVYEGLVLSTRIAALHASGAVRGFGAEGLELSAVHDRAELAAKVLVVVLAVVVVTNVASARERARGPVEVERSSTPGEGEKARRAA